MPNDRQYEFVYVLAPTVANAEVETLQRELEEHIGKVGGAVENTDLWGRRKLAYPIGNFTEGIYVVQLIRGPGAMVTELERRMRVHDDVLRYLTVRVDDDLRKARRAAEKRKAETERRRAARGLAGEPSPPPPALEGEAPAASDPPPPAVTPPIADAEPSPSAPEAASPEAAPAEAAPAEAASPAEAPPSGADEASVEGEPAPPAQETPPAPPATESDEPAGA
jgi:small subunit ribosomal protein S6